MGRTKPGSRRTGPAIGYAVLAAALLATGCGGPDDEVADPPTVAERIREFEPVEPVEPVEPADAYPGRDPDAVLAGLWRLDPCALIAPGPSEPGTVYQYSPHVCSLSVRSAEVYVELGQRLQAPERSQLGSTSVAGAKAYLLPGDGPYGGCEAWLPVGSTRAIRFDDELDECGRLRGLVERTVERIDAPSARSPVPGLGGLDTCALLAYGLGPERMDGRKVVFGDGGTVLEGIDLCSAVAGHVVAQSVLPGDGFASLELETSAEQTLTFEEGVSDTPAPDDYASSGWPADFGTIRGRRVFGARSGSCTMRWAESTTVLELDTRTCAQARPIVTRMTELLDGPARERVAPQEPLLYAADEPDTAARGECVDYLPLWFGREYTPGSGLLPGPECHPYIEPEVPDGAAETVVAAEADPNVTCAIAAGAVREEFGTRLRPATLDVDLPAIWRANPGLHDAMPPPLRVRPCVFVDPEREIQVQVFVSSDPMAVSPDFADELVKNDSAMRTLVGPGTYGLGTGYLIGLGAGPDDPGYVAVFAGRRHQRTSGSGYYGTMQGSQDDTARVADAILDEYLSP